MRALIQRVARAAVRVEGRTTGAIDRGLLILVGARQGDDPAAAEWLAEKIAGLRVFADAEGRMNLDLLQAGGGALVVPQFTLYGDARRGRRPDFTAAARPETAATLIDHFCAALARPGLTVARGVFQAHMEVELINDGPVTLMIESPAAPGAA